MMAFRELRIFLSKTEAWPSFLSRSTLDLLRERVPLLPPSPDLERVTVPRLLVPESERVRLEFPTRVVPLLRVVLLRVFWIVPRER